MQKNNYDNNDKNNNEINSNDNKNNKNNDNENENQQIKNINASWLTISFEGAFDVRKNVFNVQHLSQIKRHGSIRISARAQT
jgi:hypothetical protein